jgi:hypothetical protein
LQTIQHDPLQATNTIAIAMSKYRPVIVALCVSLLGYAPVASAYLDPGTGSMILSAIVGLFATAALAFKTYWYKIKRMLTGKHPARKAQPAEDEKKEPSGGDSF